MSREQLGLDAVERAMPRLILILSSSLFKGLVSTYAVRSLLPELVDEDSLSERGTSGREGVNCC